jgi:hypothetical protein
MHGLLEQYTFDSYIHDVDSYNFWPHLGKKDFFFLLIGWTIVIFHNKFFFVKDLKLSVSVMNI